MTAEFHPAAKAVLEFMAPSAELGWPGVPWFTEENAEELISAHLGDAGWSVVRDAPVEVIAVHHHDIEKQAEHFNEGFAAAVEQFAGLLVEIRSDLATMALAKDVLGWLDDAVKAMDGGR